MLKGLRAPAKRDPRDTRTRRLLKQKMAEVTTWQQFEEIVAAAHPDNRGRIRKMLEPLLRDDLPCCGQATLSIAAGDTVIKHGARCPSRNRVVLAEN